MTNTFGNVLRVSQSFEKRKEKKWNEYFVILFSFVNNPVGDAGVAFNFVQFGFNLTRQQFWVF